ncbi:MAG: NAD-dependent epimerase [Bacteroidales bacterium]
MKRILVTGTAGFIGFHVAKRLLDEGYEVTGLDCINDYYDVNLKYARLRELGIDQNLIRDSIPVQSARYPSHQFIKLRLEDRDSIPALFRKSGFDTVIHLAAQAGVRYSLENPWAYIESNIIGYLNILEACRHFPVEHLVFASSSSVYGLNKKMPLSVSDNVDHPISLYAATKKSDELMSHVYSHLYGIPVTGLRFFTVYGPWGRPDMALFLFTKAILEGKPIEIYNHGKMIRDFTYVDDIVEGIVRVARKPPAGDPSWSGKNPDPSSSPACYRLCNIGNSSPVKLEDFIDAIEQELGRKAERIYLPMQPGDVPETFADVRKLEEEFGYRPETGVSVGIQVFVQWYKEFFSIKP